MKENIVVNNPAARSGGALTILKNHIEKFKKDTKNNYYIIVSLEELKKYEAKNIKVIVIKQQNFKNRILWDNFKLKLFLKTNNIIADKFISLQNTGVNLSKNIPQKIYFHNALVISKYKWSPLKKDERLFFFYEKIYPYFVKQYLKRVETVEVQAEWIKKNFSEKFKYPLENIKIIKPKIDLPKVNQIKNIKKEKFQIFYPAAPIKYKNHKLIIESLKDIKEDYECLFTFSKEDNLELFNLIKKYDLESKIKLIGKISYKTVLEYYKTCDLVVFPSSIETYGLPLVEAAYFNKEILVADKEYSREVLGGYKKVKYIEDKDNKKWANGIKMIIETNICKFKD